MKEKQDQPDRHLDAPAEANRDKHINFIEQEEESERLVNYKDEDKFSKRRQEQMATWNRRRGKSKKQTSKRLNGH